MLIILPFYFATGFCIGYFGRELRSSVWLPVSTFTLREIRRLRLEQFGVPALALAVIAVIFLVEELVRTSFFSVSHILEFAGVIVGALGGVWFKSRARTRDQLVFLAGAAAFLFLGALEYDNRIFRNLSKIGGSEFSVEFSTQGGGNTNDRSTPPIDAGQGFLGIALPGTNAVELALGHLVLLPRYIVDDEKYSVLFSIIAGEDGKPTYRLAKPIFEMPILTKQYLNYTCGVILASASTVLALQEKNEGEFSVLNIPNPEVVLGLLRVYLGVKNKIDQETNADLIQLAQSATDQLKISSKIDPDALAKFAQNASSYFHPSEECLEISRELTSWPIGSPSIDQLSVIERLGYYPGEKWLSSTQLGDGPDPTGTPCVFSTSK